MKPEPLSVPVPVIPDHELLQVIGRGSYGEVWLGRSKLGTLRAIKIVYRRSFEDARPFEREFKGIQKFEPISRSHEGLVDILQVGGTDEYFYYVMELADDVNAESEEGYSPHTLRSEQKRRGHLPGVECVRIGLSLASALAHLHAQRLVHRDVKPSNIIFVGGLPKLADIGLVADLSEAHSFVGTEGFIPPEGPGTPQADLYSLGKVLYELCTGKDRNEYPALPPDLRERPDASELLELNAVLVRACATDPRQRYESAAALQADLTLLQQGKSVKDRRAMGRRLRIGAKAVVLALPLALVAIGGVFWRNAPLVQQRQTENPEVTMLCKLARFHYNKVTEESYAKGTECLNRALEIDPISVSTYATIADLCVVGQPSQFLPPKAAEARMRWARDKLMAIDSGSAEAHAVQGFIHLVYDWDPSESERQLNRALELDPELLIAHIWRGRLFVYTGKFEAAEAEYKKARQLDPTRYGLNVHVGLPSFYARRYDRAIDYFEKAIEVVPTLDWAISMIGRAHEEKGDYAAAIEAFQKAERARGSKPEVIKQKYDALRDAYEKSGHEGYWRKKLAIAQSEYGRWIAWFEALEIARLCARLGDADPAFEWLAKAFQEKSEYLLWLSVDPGWDNIRSDPRFIALLKRMGLGR